MEQTMIKAKSGNTVMLFLDEENVKRLKEDQPIHIKGADLGVKEDIVIAYGETIPEIQKKFNLPMVN